MVDGNRLDVQPIVDLLTQILEELQELRREIRELPSQIGAEVSAQL